MERNITLDIISILSKYKEMKESMTTYKLDGDSLKLEELIVACENTKGSIKWKVEEKALEKMQLNRQFLEDLLSKETVIYGVNTGFGGNADMRLPDEVKVQKALIQLLSAGFGETLNSKIVRGAMVVRANCLCRGYSGVRPDVVKCLVDMLNNDIIPIVPKRGSISASGDLVPTAYIAAAMMGRPGSKVVLKGVETLEAKEAFKRCGLQNLAFEAKEALAVTNSSSVAATLGSSVVFDAAICMLMTQVVTALAVEALNGRSESFHPFVQKSMPHLGQIETAQNIMKLIKGSELVYHELEVNLTDKGEGHLKQDRYALRTSPQWLSPVVETIGKVIQNLLIDLNSTNDNPIVNHETSEILHCGNFQGTTTSVSMDQTRQAMQLCGRLLFAQMSEILNHNENNGLTPNLCGGFENDTFGMKGMDITMASYMSELDYYAAPITNHVHSAEMHNQSVNSLALISSRLAKESLNILQMMISNILLAQVQAVDLRWLHKELEKLDDEILNTSGKSWLHDTLKKLPLIKENNEAEFELISNLYQDLQDGKKVKEVANNMGEGTREIYLWVRQELHIPFYDGSQFLDENLEKVFAAIKSRALLPVLINIF